jgi:hypothetical protein
VRDDGVLWCGRRLSFTPFKDKEDINFMDDAARDKLTSALDAATTELGQAHADTGRAIETATNAQARAIAGKYEPIAQKLSTVISRLEEHHGHITTVEQAVTDARAAVLTAAGAGNPQEAVARWNDTQSRIDTAADANLAALDHLDRQILPLAADATSGSGGDTVLAINQITHSHQQAAKTGIGRALKGISDAVAEARRIDSGN